MIILLDNFLAKEEWRKYQLLKRVERSSYFALTKKELMDYLEISNYVLKSTIDQLILDLERFGLAEEIHLFVEEPFVQLEVTGTASSETLLENYVEESISFNILLGAVLGKFKSLNELSEKEMISYPIAHSTYKKLNKYLAAFDLTIDKKFRLSGKSEKNVRLFLTELFSRIYKRAAIIFLITRIRLGYRLYRSGWQQIRSVFIKKLICSIIYVSLILEFSSKNIWKHQNRAFF